jgi:RNA polymerase sigma factor (sigma-70 family)
MTGHGIEDLLRELTPQVLGAVVRRYGNFDTAEDAVQEALVAANAQWPLQGLPTNPRGWLVTVASRRMTDLLRRDQARRCREQTVASWSLTEQSLAPAPDRQSADTDDALILLFMCCHPSLSPSSQIALTLRSVGGLSTAEVARAFLVPEGAMTRRITRAKRQIRDSGIPFAMPTGPDRAGRLDAVLHVLYLIFNEGYSATAGSRLYRGDLSAEAIRLARMMHRLMPEDAEVTGLVALMLLTEARRPARTGPEGELIPLADQNRRQWDAGLIEEGVALISEALPRGSAGPYLLQAAIAAIHDEAPSFEETDWAQILAFYELLMTVSESPVVALNHAVAAAMVEGPQAGLELLEHVGLDKRLAGDHRRHAVRGHLLEMSGDVPGAIASYEEAARWATGVQQQRYLYAQVARLSVA